MLPFLRKHLKCWPTSCRNICSWHTNPKNVSPKVNISYVDWSTCFGPSTDTGMCNAPTCSKTRAHTPTNKNKFGGNWGAPPPFLFPASALMKKKQRHRSKIWYYPCVDTQSHTTFTSHKTLRIKIMPDKNLYFRKTTSTSGKPLFGPRPTYRTKDFVA